MAAATWPAYRAARRPPVEILRGGDLARTARATRTRSPVRPRHPLRHRRPRPLVRGRRDDRGLRGRGHPDARARVAARAPARGPRDGRQALPARGLARHLPGPAGARDPGRRRRSGSGSRSTRRTRSGSASRSGSSPTSATTPSSRRRRSPRGGASSGPNEVEVGVGMADALGLRPGSTLAAQIPDGGEVRFKVAGIVRALENDGRIAWVQPEKLLAARPDLNPQVVVRLEPGADPAAVTQAAGRARRPPAAGRCRADRQRRLPRRARRGAPRRRPRGRARLPVRARPGADRHRARAPRRGRAAARGRRRRPHRRRSSSPARRSRSRSRRRSRAWCSRSSVFGPLVARLAASFASLPLSPTVGQVALVTGGLLALSVIATALVARRVLREPVVAGLREE